MIHIDTDKTYSKIYYYKDWSSHNSKNNDNFVYAPASLVLHYNTIYFSGGAQMSYILYELSEHEWPEGS
ncbi:hypothetical protein ACJX0J_006577, partial [Zea mays]